MATLICIEKKQKCRKGFRTRTQKTWFVVAKSFALGAATAKRHLLLKLGVSIVLFMAVEREKRPLSIVHFVIIEKTHRPRSVSK